MVGWTDLPADLSDTARLARLADYLPGDGVVVSSDLIRAADTADAIAGSRERLPHDRRLREMHFGDWEGKAFAEIEAQDAARARAFYEQPGDVRAPGGETWNELSERVERGVAELARAHKDRPLVLVAHFAVILTQVQRAWDVPAYDVLAQRIDNLSVTRIEWGGTRRADPVNHIP